MRVTLPVLLLMATLVLAGAPFGSPPVDAEDGLAPGYWYLDLGTARAVARKTGRPILAVFR